jgi:peroxiredoxin 2/4
MYMVKVLEVAPNFKLPSTQGDIELNSIINGSRYGGEKKWLVMFFYSGDFTSVCTTEAPEFARQYAKFKELNAEVIGISADSVYSHNAWIAQLKPHVSFPLLSDFKKEVCRMYDILDENTGEPLRGTFIISPDGKIRFKMMIDPDLGQNVNEVMRVLQALQTGKSCPANWVPGNPTL